jgi:hypothetical protein
LAEKFEKFQGKSVRIDAGHAPLAPLKAQSSVCQQYQTGYSYLHGFVVTFVDTLSCDIFLINFQNNSAVADAGHALLTPLEAQHFVYWEYQAGFALLQVFVFGCHISDNFSRCQEKHKRQNKRLRAQIFTAQQEN